MHPILFITQNNYKFEKFMQVAQGSPLKFKQLALATPEIQAETNEQVAKIFGFIT